MGKIVNRSQINKYKQDMKKVLWGTFMNKPVTKAVILAKAFAERDKPEKQVDKADINEFYINFSILKNHIEFLDETSPVIFELKDLLQSFTEFDDYFLKFLDESPKDALDIIPPKLNAAKKNALSPKALKVLDAAADLFIKGRVKNRKVAIESLVALQTELPDIVEHVTEIINSKKYGDKIKIITKTFNLVDKLIENVNEYVHLSFIKSVCSRMKQLTLKCSKSSITFIEMVPTFASIFYLADEVCSFSELKNPKTLLNTSDRCMHATLLGDWKAQKSIFSNAVVENLLLHSIMDGLAKEKKPPGEPKSNLILYRETADLLKLIVAEIENCDKQLKQNQKDLKEMIAEYVKKKKAQAQAEKKADKAAKVAKAAATAPNKPKPDKLVILQERYDKVAIQQNEIAENNHCLKSFIDKHLKMTQYFLNQKNIVEAKKALDYLEKEVKYSLKLIPKIEKAFELTPKLKGIKQLKGDMDSDKLEALAEDLNEQIKLKNRKRRTERGKAIPLIILPYRG